MVVSKCFQLYAKESQCFVFPFFSSCKLYQKEKHLKTKYKINILDYHKPRLHEWHWMRYQNTLQDTEGGLL